MYKRPCFNLLMVRLKEQRQFLQVLAGPRQSGKTTLARQIMEEYPGQTHYVSADEPAIKSRIWIEQQWDNARLKITEGKKVRRGLLILDEIQKIPGWSETVKYLWDQDTAKKLQLHVLILGSSPLLVQKGLIRKCVMPSGGDLIPSYIMAVIPELYHLLMIADDGRDISATLSSKQRYPETFCL